MWGLRLGVENLAFQASAGALEIIEKRQLNLLGQLNQGETGHTCYTLEKSALPTRHKGGRSGGILGDSPDHPL